MKKTLALVAAAVVILAVGGWFARDAWIDHQRCETFDALAAEFGTDPIGSGTREVAVVGDSYTEGMELEDPRQSWVATFAEQAGATVDADAASGTGFTNPGPCEQGDFASRTAPGGGLLVVQGGLNDIDAPGDQIEAAACGVIAKASGDVVIVGPPAAPARDHGDVEKVDQALGDAGAECGARYVSTLDWDLDYTDGGLHMTPAGHHTFGTMVAAQLG